MRTLSAVAFLLPIFACQAPPPERLSEADRAAIDGLVANYDAAIRAGDWAAMAELWTEDAVYQIPDAPALVGREAMVADFQRIIEPPSENYVRISASDGSGKWAWARGTWLFATAATEEMSEVRREGSFLWVLERQPDGRWLIDTECYNLDAPTEIPPEG
jgi:uncharacterized protein (TIGR02246 family)